MVRPWGRARGSHRPRARSISTAPHRHSNSRAIVQPVWSERTIALQLPFIRRTACPSDLRREPAAAGTYYRIHNLYDYARAAFGHRLAVQSYRSHWNQIESVVESYRRDDEAGLEVLKTVAVLNLIDSPHHIATEEAISLAVAGAEAGANKRVKGTLRDLQRGKVVLYFRGAAGGYCLWPHTSVNLERAYQEALKAVPTPTCVGTVIRSDLETRPLVARRHYIETGNLRHFAVEYASPADLPSLLDAGPRERTVKFLWRFAKLQRNKKQPPRLLAGLLLATTTRCLLRCHSRFAVLQAFSPRFYAGSGSGETFQNSRTMNLLRKKCPGSLPLQGKCSRSGCILILEFGNSARRPTFNGSIAENPRRFAADCALLERLSSICDKVFDNAPRFRNELVNRHSLSSAAAAARLRLIEQILTAPGKPLLGMDPAKKPPEMSMYLSVLQAAGLHREEGGVWRIAEPQAGDDTSNVRPLLARILEILEARRGGRVKVTDLFAELRRPPFGLRDGLAPLLLAVFVAIHERDVAFYENGGFLREVTGYEFQRLIKATEIFEIQYCKIGGVRAVVFEKLFRCTQSWKGTQGRRHPGCCEAALRLCQRASPVRSPNRRPFP